MPWSLVTLERRRVRYSKEGVYHQHKHGAERQRVKINLRKNNVERPHENGSIWRVVVAAVVSIVSKKERRKSQRRRPYDGAAGCEAGRLRHQENPEPAPVPFPDARADEIAVVVEGRHAPAARLAVVRSKRRPEATDVALLPPRALVVSIVIIAVAVVLPLAVQLLGVQLRSRFRRRRVK